MPAQKVPADCRQGCHYNWNHDETRPQVLSPLLCGHMIPFLSASLKSVTTGAEMKFPSYSEIFANMRRRSPKHDPATATVMPANQNQHDEIEDSEHTSGPLQLGILLHQLL